VSDQVFVFPVTTAAGVTAAAPTTTACAMPVRIVRRISVRIPPGPNGHLGFRIAAGGTQMIPVNVGQWIITDNEALAWDIARAIESGAWQVQSYNTGIYPHTIEVRFEVDLPPQRATEAVFKPLPMLRG
jgi:hypothetical protein